MIVAPRRTAVRPALNPRPITAGAPASAAAVSAASRIGAVSSPVWNTDTASPSDVTNEAGTTATAASLMSTEGASASVASVCTMTAQTTARATVPSRRRGIDEILSRPLSPFGDPTPHARQGRRGSTVRAL